MRYKIIVVDDEAEHSSLLSEYILRYGEAVGAEFDLKVYDKPLVFLQEYHSDADILFADIKMPNMTGMELAKAIRRIDKELIVVFTTGFSQYAVDGYAVQAAGYLLKPLKYPAFKVTMDRLMKILVARVDKSVTVRDERGIRRLAIKNISYIEVLGRELSIYLGDGGVVKSKGTLRELEKELSPFGFFRCEHSYLVNLQYVTSVEKTEITISGNERIPLSRERKKDFMKAFALYIGKN